MYQDALQQLGLSEKEAEVYMALIRYGASPASTLAQRTRIKRTSMYDVLNILMSRNLILSFQQGASTYFVVDDVNKLYYEEKQRLELAESLVTQLRHDQSLQPGIQIHYYKGQQGYRELYEDILRVRPKEFLAWIHLDFFFKGLDPVREETWTLERVQKKIHARLLLQDTAVSKTFRLQDVERFRETRVLSKKHFFKTTCFLYEGYVVFFDATEEISGIRIYNQELFRMQKEIFEMNWESLNA